MHQTSHKKIIIIGATSGIGRELAIKYLTAGQRVGITGRREDKLKEISCDFPELAYCRYMDVQSEQSIDILEGLIAEMGGMDALIFCAGVGSQNKDLDYDTEMNTIHTNVVGFSRILIYSFHYFKKQNSGHIVDISSVAATRPLKIAAAYSTSKRFQTHYMSCLAQKAYSEKLPVYFTTVIPGFIKTDFVKHTYPLMISLERAVNLIYNAIEKKKRKAILPARWKWIVALWNMIPEKLWEKYLSRFV